MEALGALGVEPGLPRWSQSRMGFAVRVRSAGQKYGPTCHQKDCADVTEFVTLVRLSSLGQHVGVLALAGYKCRKSALMVGPIVPIHPNILSGNKQLTLHLAFLLSSECLFTFLNNEPPSFGSKN